MGSDSPFPSLKFPFPWCRRDTKSLVQSQDTLEALLVESVDIHNLNAHANCM